MSTYLYHLVENKPEKVLVEAMEVEGLLKSGYAVTSEQLENRKKADTNNTGLISDAEVKALAKAEGVKVGRKSIAALKKELNL
jgi:hypothetical protein